MAPQERANPLIRVAVSSALPLDQAALAALVASLPGMDVVPVDATPPPSVLLWAPGQDRREAPPAAATTAVLILTEQPERVPQEVQAMGFFSRQETAGALGVAIRQVARGHEYLSPTLALVLLQQAGAPPAEANLDALTAREREMLVLLAQGLSNKDIAARLYLSVRTVEGHLTNAYAKLDVHSRTEAVLLAARLF